MSKKNKVNILIGILFVTLFSSSAMAAITEKQGKRYMLPFAKTLMQMSLYGEKNFMSAVVL